MGLGVGLGASLDLYGFVGLGASLDLYGFVGLGASLDLYLVGAFHDAFVGRGLGVHDAFVGRGLGVHDAFVDVLDVRLSPVGVQGVRPFALADNPFVSGNLGNPYLDLCLFGRVLHTQTQQIKELQLQLEISCYFLSFKNRHTIKHRENSRVSTQKKLKFPEIKRP